MSEIRWDDSGEADMGGQFEFRLQRPNWVAEGSWRNVEYWGVSLPHQCESWDVGGGRDSSRTTHADVVADLEQFISEAQIALAALRDAQTGV